MEIIDILLKDTVARAGRTLTSEKRMYIADRQQIREDYLVNVFTKAPRELQVAIRDLARANSSIPTHEAQGQLALILDALLSPPYDFTSSNPNEGGPTISPPSNTTGRETTSSESSPSPDSPIRPGDAVSIHIDLDKPPPPFGTVIRYEYGFNSLESVPNVTAFSPVWDHIALRLPQGNAPFIVKTRYFTGFNPSGKQSLAVYRLDPAPARAKFVESFVRRSQNSIKALNYINEAHIFQWRDPH
jgi:hypothetical protein